MDSKFSHQTALVSFHIGGKESLIFWIDGSSQETYVSRTAVGRAEIAEAAAKLQKLFSPERINYRRPEYTTDMVWLEPLGQKLLSPLAPRLAVSNTLIVAPHAELHSLPLHLLSHDGGAPLGMTHSISYVANLSLYALLLNRGAVGSMAREISSLCLACAAREDPESVRESFSISPKSYAEKTGGMFVQSTEATWRTFRSYAESATNIYLSCHGVFDEEDSLASTLLLSDGKALPSRLESNGQLYQYSVRDILEKQIQSRLVILDACMSGVQHFSPGDEPMGFPTAFLLSGASAVIASNWVVEQNCTRYFMMTLLEHWSTGSASLGEAMQKAYSLTRFRYPHPFHWAAFSLFGNDRMLFK